MYHSDGAVFAPTKEQLNDAIAIKKDFVDADLYIWRKKLMWLDYEIHFADTRHQLVTLNPYSTAGVYRWYILVPKRAYPHKWNDMVSGIDDCCENSDHFKNSWFFYDITYAEKVTNKRERIDLPYKDKWIKVGCDYMHSDQPDIDFETVCQHAHQCACEFLNLNDDYSEEMKKDQYHAPKPKLEYKPELKLEHKDIEGK